MGVLTFDEKMDKRIEFDRLINNVYAKNGNLTKEDFSHYIFLLGLICYEDDIIPEKLGKHYKAFEEILDKVICSGV